VRFNLELATDDVIERMTALHNIHQCTSEDGTFNTAWLQSHDGHIATLNPVLVNRLRDILASFEAHGKQSAYVDTIHGHLEQMDI